MSRSSLKRRTNSAPPEGGPRALRRIHPDHLRIARAAVGVLLFTLIAKVAVAAREVVIAWRFGRGHEVDAYNLAMTFSTWLPLALVSVMTIVLVPVLVRLGIENSDNRTHFLRELSGVGLLVGVTMSIATWILAPWLVQWVGPGLPDATRDLFRVMLRSLAPVALLTVLVGVYATRLQAENDHRYALAEGLPPFVVVLLLLVWQSEGAAPLIVGTLAGFAWQVGWLARRSGNGGATLQFALSMRASQWSALWRGALVMGAGQLAMSFTQPIDQWFAANVGSGAIATLGYANRLVSLGMALGATVISRATLPIFSEGVARGDSGRIRRYALGWAGSMLLIGVVGAALVSLAAHWLVSLLFERGAFSSADTRAVAEALQWGIWQLPAFLAGLVLVSQLASAGRYHLIGTFAAVATLGKVVATYLLTPQMGVNGILLASALMYSLSAAFFLYAVSRPIPRQSAAAD